MNTLILKFVVFLMMLFFINSNAQINLGKLKDKAAGALKKTEKVAEKVKQTTGKDLSVKNTVERKVNNAVSDATGNIWFSKTRDGKAEKNFTSADNIYAHIKLSKPLGEVLEDVRMNISGEVKVPTSLTYVLGNAQYGEYVTYKVSKDDLSKTEFILDILPGSDAKSQYFQGGYKNHIGRVFNSWDKDGMASEIPFGSQRFEMTFVDGSMYEGAFNFTVKNKQELASVKKRIEGVDNAMDDAIASQMTLPENFKKSGKFADPALTMPKIKEMIQWEGMTILKIAIENIGGSDWNVNKDEYDLPLRKVSNKPVWVAYKDKGKCYFTKKYFTREYEGGGKYGPVELATSTADVTPIACENIK